jgi:hypothetical protein
MAPENKSNHNQDKSLRMVYPINIVVFQKQIIGKLNIQFANASIVFVNDSQKNVFVAWPTLPTFLD